MKFNLKPRLPHGAMRVKSGFLWWPKRVDLQYRWLERAKWRERYHHGYDEPDFWTPFEWLTETNRQESDAAN